MREIFFRGKRDGEWIEGDSLTKGKYTFVGNEDSKGNVNFEEIDPETLGIWTGLTDKNGRKIFEGDIVNFEHCGSNYCAKIDYERCSYWIINYNVQFPAFLGSVSEEHLEIIGNVHDNPELLEVTK